MMPIGQSFKSNEAMHVAKGVLERKGLKKEGKSMVFTIPPFGHMHCLIAFEGLPYWHHQLVLSWYIHQAESHLVNSQQG